MSNLIRSSSTGHLLFKSADGHLLNSLAAAPTITTTSLPNATPAIPYSTTMAATGGTTPYTWSIASGSLPSGLSISSGGVISGTSTAVSGTYSLSLRVTDAASHSDTVSFTLTVGTLDNLAFTISFTPSGSKWIEMMVQDPDDYLYDDPGSSYYIYKPGPSPVPAYAWSEDYQASFGGSLISPNGGTMTPPSSYGSYPIIYTVDWSGSSPSGVFYIWFYGQGGAGSQSFTLTITSGSTTIYTHTYTMNTNPNQVSGVVTFNSTTGVVS